jgi:integrase
MKTGGRYSLMSQSARRAGVPGKVTAQLMGHANVDTTINVYTQVLDGSVREAVERVGDQLNEMERSAKNSAGATTPSEQIA